MMLKRLLKLVLIQTAVLFSLMTASANTRLAIGTFGLAANRDAELADLVATSVSTSRGFEVVERRELDAALNEAGLGLAGVVRAKDAAHIGTLLRADKFLLGSSMRLNGTNILVVRLVDARKGTMENVSVFRDAGSLKTLAVDIAGFVRDDAEHLAHQHRDYLAVGVVQNLGINNRFSDFPIQMRGYVAAKLSGKATVLERDVMSFLADEVRLDMMGLTGQDAEHVPHTQFGFWIVDGFYQSYEVAEPVVQLNLRVERVLGGQQSYTLQGKPEEAFFKHICDSITKTMDHPPAASPVLPPSRQGEIAALEARGGQLIDYLVPNKTMPSRIRLRVASNPDKVMNTLDEATRAFESILLLDPSNNAAKMRLAGCLLFNAKANGGVERTNSEERTARAQEYYREVIAASDPSYADDARISLAISYRGAEGLEMLARFAEEAQDEKRGSQFVDLAHYLLHFVADKPVETLIPSCRKLLLRQAELVQTNTSAVIKIDFQPVLFGFRARPDDREKVMNAALPDLLQKFPALEPYILLEAAGEQFSSNSPVIAQFRASLRKCEEHPESVLKPGDYFTHLSSTIQDEKYAGQTGFPTLLRRIFDNRQYETVIAMVLGRQGAAEKGLAPPVTDIGKQYLASSYMAVGRWQEALSLLEGIPGISAELKNECRNHLGIAPETVEVSESDWKDKGDAKKVAIAYGCVQRQQWTTALSILESIGHRTVRMNTVGASRYAGGAWGRGYVPAIPAVLADECRAKAGRPGVVDPMRFEFDRKPYVYFASGGASSFSFAAEGDDLWMVTHSQIKLFRGAGPFVSTNPIECHDVLRTKGVWITSTGLNADYIWAGTAGDGLLELNRKTGATRRITVHDGLYLDDITSVGVHGDKLWIGYRNGRNGAVGTMDVATHKFSAFTAKISAGAGTNSQPFYIQAPYYYQPQAGDPPEFPVTGMAPGETDEMWFAVSHKGAERFRSPDNNWFTFSQWNDNSFLSGIITDPANHRVLITARDPNDLENEKSVTGGLTIYNYQKNLGDRMLVKDGLPSNDLSAIALDGKYAWIGGKGFVAVVDVQERKVVRIGYICANRIAKIQLGSRYAWIQVSCEEDGDWDYGGNARTGVYRVDRAAAEPKCEK
jgi:hypothetical protein